MNEAEIRIARQYPDYAAGSQFLQRALHPKLVKGMDEEEFERIVANAARIYFGWWVFHVRKAIKADGGWITPVSYDGKDYPDLHMLRPTTGHSVAAELKVKKNKPTDGQIEWLDRFEACGTSSFVWWPKDLEQIKHVLQFGVAVEQTRIDTEGRDVTGLPGLWDESDSSHEVRE